MIVIEIPPNPNCEPVELRVFHDLEPPRPVAQVLVERTAQPSHWCLVTGWTQANEAVPAQARKVDDSGEGIVWLVSGGDAGLRLQPAWQPRPWSLDEGGQWGMPFLLMADPRDLRFLDPSV